MGKIVITRTRECDICHNMFDVDKEKMSHLVLPAWNGGLFKSHSFLCTVPVDVCSRCCRHLLTHLGTAYSITATYSGTVSIKKKDAL